MKHTLTTLAMLAGLAFQPAMARLCVQTFEDGKWQGTWQDDKGGLMVIQTNDHFLDITGSDKASFYHLACVLDKANMSLKASCVGDGVNHTSDVKRFIYRSSMQINQDGTLSEEWTADLYGNRFNAKSVFQRVTQGAAVKPAAPASEPSSR